MSTPLGEVQAGILREAVQLRRAQYETDISQDLAILENTEQEKADTSTRRLKMAVQVRLGEKEILQSLAARLDGVAAPGLKRQVDTGDHGDDTRGTKAQKV